MFEGTSECYSFKMVGIVAAAVMMFAGQASASGLTFQGQNAALFPGANPSDTAALMNSVPKKKAPPTPTPGIDPAQLILQSVQSQTSSRIFAQIFNSANASGNYDLGGGSSISFVRIGGNIEITFIDPVHGTTTITLPDI